MRPPFRAVCDRRFDPGKDGDHVSFRADRPWPPPSDDPTEDDDRAPFTGQPPHVEWFCAEHLAAARELSHLTRDEAMRRLGGEG